MTLLELVIATLILAVVAVGTTGYQFHAQRMAARARTEIKIVEEIPYQELTETSAGALILDGQTVVIGGLKKQDVRQQQNKVPLLGDLPLLGGLFRFNGESTVNSELVIFITPRIFTTPQLSTDEQRYLQETDIPSPRSPQPRIPGTVQ
jgi:type II secretory pathway component GspD/PulD (secretin)